MKKILSLLIVFTVMLSVLVGCKKDTTDTNNPPPPEADDSFKIPEGLSGTDVIKLLLASKRLNSQLLKNDGDLFESGVEVMQTLASRAKSNLRSATYISTTHEAPRGGKVEIDGDTFTWSGFVENCNSYDYFENITQNIISSAELGAELIDDTKKYVRVVDKWVSVDERQYYLSVDEDSETIFSRENDMISICKRHKNDSGENVYEMYLSSQYAESRMLYIPGERYEWTEINNEGNGTYFVADNSKGYWENLVISEAPEHYNVSCFVMKKDLCYDAIYSPELEEISSLKTMSSDRATDVLFFEESMSKISLQLGAFDGISNVEIVAPADKVAPSFDDYTDTITVIHSTSDSEIYATTTGVESAVINLENGGRIENGASYADGTVTAGRTVVSYGSGIYTGQLEITVAGETDEEIFTNLNAFLDEAGLVCRRDINTVLSGIKRAYAELDSFINYYRWNTHRIKTNEDIASAISDDNKLTKALYTLYEAVKDAQVIDFSDKETFELNIDFSPVTLNTAGNASFENMKVEVIGLVLTVSDTTLFVENSSYIIDFALIKEGTGTADIVHLPTHSPTEIIYTGTETFTLGISHTTLDIPKLEEGKYTLVCFVATNDNIRASQYTPVALTQIDTSAITLTDCILTPEHGQNGELLLTYIKSNDISVNLEKGTELDYVALCDLLKEQADRYGIVSSDSLEILDPESATFIPISDTEAPLVSGSYRIAYDVTDGETFLNGYIHAEYTAPNTR